MKNGFVGGLYFPKESPLSLVVVWNIKTKAAVLDFLRRNENPFRNFERFEKGRYIPREVLDWVRNRIKRTKPDKYGIPGGMLESRDFETAESQGQPQNFADFGLIRELREESGLVVVREEGAVRKELFERVVTLYDQDHDQPGKIHQSHFYWLREVDGELRKDGAEGETEAPEVCPILALNPKNFYPKHAFALGILLRRMVREYGMKEYQVALEHIARSYGQVQSTALEPDVRVPRLNLTDEDLWASFTGQKDIVRMQK